MATARDLINDALTDLGVLAEGETAEASVIASGLRALNRMLGLWSIEGLLVFANVREEFPFIAGQAAYTMGPSGDFNTTRPVRILTASIEVQGGGPFEYPVDPITVDEWQLIPDKTTEAEIPQKLFFQDGFPQVTLNFWPVPSTTNRAVLFSEKELTSFASANDAVSLPPGYDEAIVSNLTVRLGPSFSKPVPAEILQIANDSIASIKRKNSKPQILGCDPAVLGPRRLYDIRSGR